MRKTKKALVRSEDSCKTFIEVSTLNTKKNQRTRSFYSHFTGAFGFTYSQQILSCFWSHTNPSNFRGFNRQFIVCLLILDSNETLTKYVTQGFEIVRVI